MSVASPPPQTPERSSSSLQRGGDAVARQSQTMMQVTVPPNVVAGQVIAVNTPAGQLLQVIVPSNLKAGDTFLVSVGADTAGAAQGSSAQAGATTAGAAQASLVLSKLGPLGGRICFGLHTAQVSKSGLTSIQGSMPLMSDGRNVATLMFESAQKGRHLSASLVLPSGEMIATFERGSRPKTAAGGIFNSLQHDFSSAAEPPVAIALQGQVYGFFNALGVGGTKGVMGGILNGTEFRHVESSKPVASTAELETSPCGFLCSPGGYKFTAPKRSSLGKKEAPLPVFFSSGGAATATASCVIHLVLPRTRFYFPVYEVLCELGDGVGNVPHREKLDVILMGAAMAAINATEKQNPGGM